MLDKSPVRTTDDWFDVLCAFSRTARLTAAVAAVLLVSACTDLATGSSTAQSGASRSSSPTSRASPAPDVQPHESGTVTGAVNVYAGAAAGMVAATAKRIFVSNRDSASVSVLDASTLAITGTWKIPGGGSPDMGGVTVDGRQLWLSGRFSSEVYVLSTATGTLIRRIQVNAGPHGLLVWPQPGSFSLGHTGNMR
jgi:YVTN family beta-propeller protein